jgi:hypothetical protein
VQVDSTVKLVLFGVKSHEKASFVEVIGYPHYSRTGLPGMRGPSLLSNRCNGKARRVFEVQKSAQCSSVHQKFRYALLPPLMLGVMLPITAPK